MSRSQSSSEKSRTPCFVNAFSSFVLIVSQWTAASDGRSAWSWWGTNLVTILEIAVVRDPHLYDELTGIIFHFLSVVGMVSSVQVHWAGRIADRVRIPGARMTYNRGRNRFPCFFLRLHVQTAIPRWCDNDRHLGYAIRPRSDAFLWIAEHWMSVLDCLKMEWRFQNPTLSRIFMMWTSMTGPIISFNNCWICSGLWVYLRMSVFSCSAYQPLPWPERSIFMFFCQLFPDAGLWEKNKKFHFLWIHALQFSFVQGFSFSRLLSNRIAHTYSKLVRKYWGDSQNAWFEARVLSLKHPHWSVRFLFLSASPEFHAPSTPSNSL